MKYGIILWPHPNARYQLSQRTLSLCELKLLMGVSAILGEPSFETIAGAEFLSFKSDIAPDEVALRLRDHAHMLMLVEMRPEGLFMPIAGPAEAFVGRDLGGILKYKGKTNEVFTRFLLNLAVYSSAFSGAQRWKLTMLDPMCGRGTTLFEALNLGINAVGSDIDRQDIHEAEVFFKRYLEYHKYKHQQNELSMTLPGKRQLKRRRIEFAKTAQDFKANGKLELSLILGDAVDAARAFKDGQFHFVVCDLPYGVQHSSAQQGKGESLEALLRRALPAFNQKIMPGGAIAISFNSNTMPRDRVQELMRAARFEVLTGPVYDNLAHWVEQAVTRDVVVGLRA